MESSFKAKFDRDVQPDGAVRLVYEERRIGAHLGGQLAATPLLFAALFVLFWLWLGVAVVISALLGEKQLGMSLVVALAIVLTATVFAGRKLRGKNAVLVVRHDGLQFLPPERGPFSKARAQLAFRDIDDIYVGTETSSTAGRLRATSYLYAHAGGQKIRLTRYVDEALAQALAREILAIAKRA